MALKPKVRNFVTEYLKDGNGQQAAIRAGYSRRTAGSQACCLLKIPKVRAAVDEAQAKAAEMAGVSLAEWLANVMELAYAKGKRDNARGQGLTILGKHAGFLKETIRHEGGEEPIQVKIILPDNGRSKP